MKAIHSKINKKEVSLLEWLSIAKEFESEDKDQAIQEYKQIALAYPTNENAYNRLMILFRQLKRPKDELYWINKAIDSFHKHFNKPRKESNTQVRKLSQSIARMTGLTDKKGNAVFKQAPVARWQLRKERLQRRIG